MEMEITHKKERLEAVAAQLLLVQLQQVLLVEMVVLDQARTRHGELLLALDKT